MSVGQPESVCASAIDRQINTLIRALKSDVIRAKALLYLIVFLLKRLLLY